MVSKYQIELKNKYEEIKERFKYKREKFITEESTKEVIKDIQHCMTPSSDGEAINEYGDYWIRLENIRIDKNKYGYDIYHYGDIGDYGWTSTVYLHKRCNIKVLKEALEKEFKIKVEIDI